MKIAGLGKKKNNDSLIEFLEEYLLPDLPSQITPVGVTTLNPTRESAPAEQKPNRPMPITPPVSEASKESQGSATEHGEEPQRRVQSTIRSSLSGLSISSLMSVDTPQSVETESKSEKVDEPQYDEKCAEKIQSNRGQVIRSILEERPRFVTAFEGMKVSGHTIMVEVPTKALYEEIMRSKTEILLMIVRSAGIKGMVDLEVVINEQVKASRPIKLEDRIQYMTQKSPLILKLKQALDMEYE